MRNRKKICLSGVKVPKRLIVSKLHGPNMRSIVRDKLDRLDLTVLGISPKNKYTQWVWNLSNYNEKNIKIGLTKMILTSTSCCEKSDAFIVAF